MRPAPEPVEGEHEQEPQRHRRTSRPAAAELARRRQLFERIVRKREERVIAPLTTADLVHQVRNDENHSSAQRMN